jgi:hypothetical protein
VRRKARVPVRAQPLVGLLRYYEDQLTPRGRYLLAVAAAFALVGLDTRRSRLHLEALPAGALDAPLRAASFEAVETLYGARFGGRPAGVGEIAELRRRLSLRRDPA